MPRSIELVLCHLQVAEIIGLEHMIDDKLFGEAYHEHHRGHCVLSVRHVIQVSQTLNLAHGGCSLYRR